MQKLAVMVGTLALMAAAAAERPEELGWLEGRWILCSDRGVTEEHWVGPRGRTLVGVNLATNGEKVSFEFLRIAPGEAGTLTYFAQPGGAAPPVAFPMVETGALRVAFENPQHDFPQRILYWRVGDVLHARIEGRIGGELRSEEWRFERKGSAHACPASTAGVAAKAPPAARPL